MLVIRDLRIIRRIYQFHAKNLRQSSAGNFTHTYSQSMHHIVLVKKEPKIRLEIHVIRSLVPLTSTSITKGYSSTLLYYDPCLITLQVKKLIILFWVISIISLCRPYT
jgi:hypothetical protein